RSGYQSGNYPLSLLVEDLYNNDGEKLDYDSIETTDEDEIEQSVLNNNLELFKQILEPIKHNQRWVDVLTLRYFDDMDLPEAAKYLDKTNKQVDNLRSNAMAKLREVYSDKEQELRAEVLGR